jgi:hypothetical protein
MTVARIWNGSSWVSPSGFNVPRVWNGEAWVNTRPRYWNGSNWGKISTLPISRTVTVGLSGLAWGYGAGVPFGFFGSINSNSNLLFYNGIITNLYWIDPIDPNNPDFAGPGALVFSLNSDEEIVTNSGWNVLTVNGVSYLRSDIQNFSFQGSTNQRGGTGTWAWPSEDDNPFTTTIGATNTITLS